MGGLVIYHDQALKALTSGFMVVRGEWVKWMAGYRGFCIVAFALMVDFFECCGSAVEGEMIWC